MTCKIAIEIEKKFGKKACCWPHQSGTECGYPEGSELRCRFGTSCPMCKETRVWAYDLCHGWHELCMNQECGMDK